MRSWREWTPPWEAMRRRRRKNEQYFDTKVLSADRDYMQRWPLKTIEQQDFLIDKLKINIQAEKDRLRRRRRRSSTMWETRLKDAQKVAMKSNPFLS